MRISSVELYFRYPLLAVVDYRSRPVAAECSKYYKKPLNTIFFSAASSWEIAIKYLLNKLPLPEPPDLFIPRRLARDGISPLAIEHSHVLFTVNLPLFHRDPFDRLLIAQGILSKVPIITADSSFSKYDVEIIKA